MCTNSQANASPKLLLCATITFINALFSCQHLYMRTNCAERDIVLESATGELDVITNEDWVIQHAAVRFTGKIHSGEPTRSALDYIIERMHHCPVSSNLPEQLKLDISVDLQG